MGAVAPPPHCFGKVRSFGQKSVFVGLYIVYIVKKVAKTFAP